MKMIILKQKLVQRTLQFTEEHFGFEVKNYSIL